MSNLSDLAKMSDLSDLSEAKISDFYLTFCTLLVMYRRRIAWVLGASRGEDLFFWWQQITKKRRRIFRSCCIQGVDRGGPSPKGGLWEGFLGRYVWGLREGVMRTFWELKYGIRKQNLTYKQDWRRTSFWPYRKWRHLHWRAQDSAKEEDHGQTDGAILPL